MSQEQDRAFFKNFTIVMIVLGVLMATFMVLGVMFGGGHETPEEAAAEAMKNTAPVAKVQIQGDEPEAAPAAEASTAMGENTETAATGSDDAGKATYDSICVACHGSGIPGIPQLGDAAEWAPRIEQGNDTLYEHAITGYTGTSGMPMPAKGGNPSLSDDAVKAAVDYMVANSQ
jgi:cytochrome c5